MKSLLAIAIVCVLSCSAFAQCGSSVSVYSGGCGSVASCGEVADCGQATTYDCGQVADACGSVASDCGQADAVSCGQSVSVRSSGCSAAASGGGYSVTRVVTKSGPGRLGILQRLRLRGSGC